MVTRREFMQWTAAGSLAVGLETSAAERLESAEPSIRWVSTNQQHALTPLKGARLGPPSVPLFSQTFIVELDTPQQTIEGFGGAFTERGWLALMALPQAARDAALDALFRPGVGASFGVCRTPIGANDISRHWYSYDEVPGDFALEHFSVANDRETLLPFIRAAQARNPQLKVWASPWSPPTWMKTNGHYALAKSWAGAPDNGIAANQTGHEGADYFIQDDRYFEAYARYFSRYVEEYAREGVRVSMVMPQNEFNSAQPFPSCCWTPEGLARFIPYLAREMGALGVDVFFGTLERGNSDLVSKALADPAVRRAVKGIGVQWAGKGALEVLNRDFPELAIWSSEQECGFGTNDWHYARYSWTTLRRYFENRASVWQYWNLVMPPDGLSGWGWPQNALVTADAASGTFRLNPDYYVLAHLSAYVQPGARKLALQTFFGYENQLVFRNPDGSLVVVMQNEMSEPLPIHVGIGAGMLEAVLPADSFNTFVVPAALLA